MPNRTPTPGPAPLVSPRGGAGPPPHTVSAMREAQDLCFRTCPRRGAVSLPVTGTRLARHPRRSGGRRQARTGPSRPPARPAAQDGRPDPRVGHIHSSRCRTTGSPEGSRARAERPGDAPAGEAGGEFSRCGRARRASGVHVVHGVGGGGELGSTPALSTVPPTPSPTRGDGGARRDRTDDLMLAKHALYRLSYCPEWPCPITARRDGCPIGGPGKTRTSDLTLIKRAL